MRNVDLMFLLEVSLLHIADDYISLIRKIFAEKPLN